MENFIINVHWFHKLLNTYFVAVRKKIHLPTVNCLWVVVWKGSSGNWNPDYWIIFDIFDMVLNTDKLVDKARLWIEHFVSSIINTTNLSANTTFHYVVCWLTFFSTIINVWTSSKKNEQIKSGLGIAMRFFQRLTSYKSTTK